MPGAILSQNHVAALLAQIPSVTRWDLLSRGLLWIFLGFVPPAFVLYGFYYLVSLPLRRQERARFFLDLLDSGLKQGRSPEHIVTEISASQDRSLGTRFHLLASYFHSGLSFRDALARVPRLLPPQITGILEVGEQIGDIRKVMPVCRGLLRDANSQMRSAFNYLFILALAATPILPLVFLVIRNLVLPKFEEVGAQYGVGDVLFLPFFQSHLIEWVALAQLVVGLLFCFGALCYVGGPRLRQWLEAGLPPLADWLLFCMPWRRKRLQRDFTALLALLLDAEVTEARAVQMAATATANSVFLRRANTAAADLRAGKKLTEALRHFDDRNEFSWRLANAAQGNGGFAAALSGWTAALDAEAFRQEQTFSQIITTSVVLASGLMVGMAAVSVFYFLTSISNAALLW